MSVLKENQCYGLSSAKLSGGGVSVFHVKLTDSAARAISTFQNGKGWSSHPTISFSGNQGRISIPCSKDNGSESRNFTFGITNVARGNPNGSFDCVQQLSTRAAEELSCLGIIQKKMTIKATDDSYDKALQSMAQVEEETRRHTAIVIKHASHGKKVTVRAPAPALASLTKPRHSTQSLLSHIKTRGGVSKAKKGVCASNKRNMVDVLERPVRERVAHLLALRPYRRPDLILRLQRDGLSPGDKLTLDSVLMEVGQLNNREKTFVLKDGLYKDLQKDWPGYTSGDQQLLKRILVRKVFRPQQTLLSVPEAQVSPLRDTPNSSPAHRAKHALPEEYIDPLANKKPRISHLSSKTLSDKSRSRLSEPAAHKDVPHAAGEEKHPLDPRKLFDSLSAACRQEDEAAQRLELPPAAQEKPDGATECSQPPDPAVPPRETPDPSRRTNKRKKSKRKHKHKCREQDKVGKEKTDPSSVDSNNKLSSDCTKPVESLFDSDVPQADGEAADYLSKYTLIGSHEQRHSYKQEFNKEYSEYRDLHARIDSVTRQFMELDTQRKQLHQDSHKYKTVHNKILQDYRHIKKSNPNYDKDRLRCEYLHSKLAHIKKLISEYDHQQLSMEHAPPK